MKQKNKFSIILCALTLLFFSISFAETIELQDSIVITKNMVNYVGEKYKSLDRIYVHGAYIDEEKYLISNVGLLIKSPEESKWENVLEWEQQRDDWWESFSIAKNENTIFSADLIWRVNKKELIIFDDYIGAFYTINIYGRDNIESKIWKMKNIKYNLRKPSFHKDMILCNVSSSYTNKLVGIFGYNFSDFNMIFEYPPKLKLKFDSLRIDPNCFPVFNPVDSTIWLAFDFYNYIYIINLQGELLDSLVLHSPAFKIPEPPLSRIKSKAVLRNWLSKTTPVKSFYYVHPGYFIQQFHIGIGPKGEFSKTELITLAWDAKKRQPVKLDIDDSMRIINVQPEGKIVCVDHNPKVDKDDAILYIMRIEP